MSRNKNNQGIQNFLTTAQLFRKEKIASHPEAPSKDNSLQLQPPPISRKKVSTHHHKYYLLNEIKEQGNKNKRTRLSESEEKDIINSSLEYVREKEVNFVQPESESLDTRNRMDQRRQMGSLTEKQLKCIYEDQAQEGKKRKKSPIQQEGQIQKQKIPFNFIGERQEYAFAICQNLQVHSSNQYFVSFKQEAMQFLNKLQFNLLEQKRKLESTAFQVRQEVQRFQEALAQVLRQNLYKIADEVLQVWREEGAKKFRNEEIHYMAELFELDMQADGRLNKLRNCKQSINESRNWKTTASDLLISNYEIDILEFCKLVDGNIYKVKEKSQQYIFIQKKNGLKKVHQLQQLFFHETIECLEEQKLLQRAEEKPSINRYCFQTKNCVSPKSLFKDRQICS